MARLIFDNKHATGGRGSTTDVLGTVRNLAAGNGFSSGSVTYSTPVDSPNPGTNTPCASVYGDSATLMKLDGLMGAMAGGYSYFGDPSGASTSDFLWCGGTITGMIQLPVYYTQPTMSDIHFYPCFGPCQGASTPDSTLFAEAVYSGAWSLLSAHGLTGNVLMVGETQPNQSCDNFTPALATQNVSGYMGSTLYTNHASLTTMRLWNNPQSACYSAPTIINPPYNSLP